MRNKKKENKVRLGMLTNRPSDLVYMKFNPLLYARVIGRYEGRWLFRVEKMRYFWLKSAKRYMKVG